MAYCSENDASCVWHRVASALVWTQLYAYCLMIMVAPPRYYRKSVRSLVFSCPCFFYVFFPKALLQTSVKQHYLCTLWVKKHTQYTRLLIITLANIDRFEKLFHYQLPDEIFYEDHKDSPSHLKYVFTLPCESWKLQLLPISTWHIACKTSEFILQDMRPP